MAAQGQGEGRADRGVTWGGTGVDLRGRVMYAAIAGSGG